MACKSLITVSAKSISDTLSVCPPFPTSIPVICRDSSAGASAALGRNYGRLAAHRGETGESGAAPAVGAWPGGGTARRLKLAIVAGLEFGRTWRVPDLGRRGGLVAESEDEDAGLNLFR